MTSFTPLDPQGLQSALPDMRVAYFDEIDSTNSHLMQLGHDAANVLAVAEMQTGGRGRRQRSWISPYRRSLSISFGWPTRLKLNELGGLSCVVGLGVAAALRACGAPLVGLKWPNDVLYQGQKLCGILIELVGGIAQTTVVVGIGVNVELTDAEIEEVSQPVIDLRRLGVTCARQTVLETIVQEVWQRLSVFETEGFAAFSAEFNQMHILHGQECDVFAGAMDAPQQISGRVEGVGADGALLLRSAEGVQAFHGGEVSVRRSESSIP